MKLIFENLEINLDQFLFSTSDHRTSKKHNSKQISKLDQDSNKKLGVKLKQLTKLILMFNKSPSYLNQSKSDLLVKFDSIRSDESSRIHEGINSQNSKWSLNDAARGFKNHRNRYNNVLPWDYNRVKLQSSKNDYINASYINLQVDDFKNREYIACQGPLERTTPHFWSMCFNEAERANQGEILIIMVTPLVENSVSKCYKYWPIQELITDGERDGIPSYKINVTGESNEFVSQGISQQTFQIVDLATGVSKVVKHIYFDKWEDFNKPTSVEPLLILIKMLNDNSHLVPIIHCSAGVGRTGTLITLEYYLNSIFASQEFRSRDYDEDLVYEIIQQLRENRMLMVQSPSQFLFVYDILRSMFSS